MQLRRKPIAAAITGGITDGLTGPIVGAAGIAVTLTLTGNATVAEGSVYTLNIAASGDDAAGITGYTVNWGDGSATEAATAGDNTHTYDDGPLNASIVVTALHPNGNKTASKSVTVGNVVPTATITGDSTATVDVAYTATISSVTDPGDDTVSTYRIYWGDGSSDDYASAGAKTHTYTSAGTGLTVRLDLIDEDGTHTNVDSYSLDVSATVTPIHSLDLTAAPSASNAFDAYGLATSRTVTDYSSRIVEIPANAVPMGGLRPVRNLWPTADGSNTPSTQVITVTSGRVYQLRIGAESASGATAVCSGAFTGTLTGDGVDIQAFDTGKTATTTSLTVTITGSVRNIQIQDITHRADLSTAPDEYVSVGAATGIGTELSEDIGFDNPGYWSPANGWSVANSEARCDAPASQVDMALPFPSPAVGAVIAYEIVVTERDGVGGNPSVLIGGVLVNLTGTGTFSGTVVVTSTSSSKFSAKAGGTVAMSSASFAIQHHGAGVDGFAYFDTELANTVASNVVTEGTGASIEGWLDYQPGDTNYADCTHDFSGGADTITLTTTGYYTLWVEGTAQVSVAAGTATIAGAGSATEGSPVTINCTATGTVTLTLDSGTLDEWGAYQIIQLNDGTVPTAFIPSTGSASRPAMSPAPTISGLVGAEDARLTVKGLGPNLITNGGFDTDSDWAKGSGWSIADGKATANLSSWVNLTQTQAGLTAGEKYLIIFSITERTSGSINQYVGGTFSGTPASEVGTYAQSIETAATSLLVYFRSTNFVGSIDNVQLYKIDPTNETHRIIDLNNIDGEFDMFEDIPIKVLSIDVYNDGERPA